MLSTTKSKGAACPAKTLPQIAPPATNQPYILLMSLFIGSHRIEIASTGSTNDDLRALLEGGGSLLSEGTVLWAHEQTKGRGQIGASWHSVPGESLTFSVLFRPTFLSPAESFRMGVVVSLAFSDLVQGLMPDRSDVRIKWPNDLYTGGRKMGGILIENSLSAHRIETSVVGIGMNVNECAFPEWLPQATSAALETGRSHGLSWMLEGLCAALERRYLQLRAGIWSELKRQYDERLYRKGEWAIYQLPDMVAPFEGMVEGVSDTGVLCLRTREGELRLFAPRTLRYL